MKGLVYNKNFRKLLIKWTIIYSVVMFMFTIVVTYSKYVSSNASVSSAKTAKFDVNIKQEFSCNELSGVTPSTVACFDQDYVELKSKPKVGFYFTLDTSDLDVSSKIVLTTTIKKNQNSYFNNYKLYDVTNLIEQNQMLNENENILSTKTSEEENEIKLEYINDYKVDDLKKHTYLLILDYDYDRYKYNTLELEKGTVSVGYSAVQID